MHRSKLAYVTCSNACVYRMLYILIVLFSSVFKLMYRLLSSYCIFALLYCWGVFFHGYKKYRAPLVLKNTLCHLNINLQQKKKIMSYNFSCQKKIMIIKGLLHKYNSLNLTLIKHFPIALLFVACIL